MIEKVAEWDHVPLGRLLWINFAIGALVAFSNGLALGFAKDPPNFVYVTVPLGLLLACMSIFGIRAKPVIHKILKVQTAILLIVLVALLAFTFQIAVFGLPAEAKRVSWNPLMFVFVCAYPIYLARRVFFDIRSSNLLLQYSHVLAILVSIPISVYVMYSVVGS
ncbi:MAG: hypothetical protein EAZ24_03140 [Burkholderiales bacterium]|nr:MAG: hypothetical protein EAZ24_03140 [Burkholderiales bacterium]